MTLKSGLQITHTVQHDWHNDSDDDNKKFVEYEQSL